MKSGIRGIKRNSKIPVVGKRTALKVPYSIVLLQFYSNVSAEKMQLKTEQIKLMPPYAADWRNL